MSINITDIQQQFPILKTLIHGNRLVYLDSSGTAHKPLSVINAICQHYQENNANIHRGVHLLSERATNAYEAARIKVQHFIKAKSSEEIIFTRGTTEGINLVAHSYVKPLLKADDEIVITTLEHHANIVPWQQICETSGAHLKVVRVHDNAELDLDHFTSLLSKKTKFVAMAHISNAFGTVYPIKTLVAASHALDIPVLIDGAQAAPHQALDMQSLDCDFYVFSGHKMYAPTGIGVLYAKADKQLQMQPYQTGGGMISRVTFEKTEFRTGPAKFEAGTPHIAGSIALGAAIDFIERIGFDTISHHETDLLNYATEKLMQLPMVRIIGTAKQKAGVISFVVDDVHAHDVGTILDRQGIAVRVGHHCAMPAMQRFGVPATVRASLGIYNTHADIDALAEGLLVVKRMFL